MRFLKLLTGHTNKDNAFEVADYPYGFRLRCKIRYWIETHKRFGSRMVSQTTNPKRGNIWNKPKAGTYSAFACMYLVEDPGAEDHVHVKCSALHSIWPEHWGLFCASGLYQQLSPDDVATVESMVRWS